MPDDSPEPVTDDLAHVRSALASRYRVERELGRGGMATVYLAHDLRHERPVAIKVLKPEIAAALGADRFQQEIKVTAKLSHPHILQLLDSGEMGDLLFYVMPYIAGESLRQKLAREGPTDLAEGLAITRQIAGALEYAHGKGVVHRDIKPENILLHEGEAMVADFGIALAISAAGGERLTATGIAIGTPAYMSPEQIRGDRDLDGRSDTYALGCLLYEMLAGEPPFAGPSVEAIIARRFSEPHRRSRARGRPCLHRSMRRYDARSPKRGRTALPPRARSQQRSRRPHPLRPPPTSRRLRERCVGPVCCFPSGSCWWQASSP